MRTREQVQNVFEEKLFTLVCRANEIHRDNFHVGKVQLSSLLSIKTGGCPENCAYCPQSAHFDTGIKRQKLLSKEAVCEAAVQAKGMGATRFCMGAAWREVNDGAEFDQVIELVKEVKAVGLEVCCTLGMLNEAQARRLKEAGLFAYNHNIDSSRGFYSKVISTRTYDDRLRTIENVRRAGLTVCTGGIIGMGETDEDRVDFLWQLSSFDPPPESITINSLIAIPGTPLDGRKPASAFELVRVIAAARVLMPKSMIRLSAGRKGLSEEAQFLCFLAGANSIFLGDKLLTSSNPSPEEDEALFAQTGIDPAQDVARCNLS
jgi:biotin synthase